MAAMDPTTLDAVAARAWCVSMAPSIEAGAASKKDIALVGKIVREHAEAWLGTLAPLVDLRASSWRGAFLDDVTLGKSKAPASAWAAAEGHAELAHVRRMTMTYSNASSSSEDDGFAAVLLHPSLTRLEEVQVNDRNLRAIAAASAHPSTTALPSMTTAWKPRHVHIQAYDKDAWGNFLEACPLRDTRALSISINLDAARLQRAAKICSELEELRAATPMEVLLEEWPRLPERIARIGTAYGTCHVVVVREADGRHSVRARGGPSGGLGTREIASSLEAIAAVGLRVRDVVVEHASKDKMPAAYVDTLTQAVARVAPETATLPSAGDVTRAPFL